MSLEHTTRAITENKYSMQLFADKESLKAEIAAMEKLKASNPNDDRVSDYAINQKKYELSQIENRIKGKDYTSVKSQCEQYFTDNSTLFDRNQIITETRSMLNRGQTVNEWPHLAAVFLLDHASVTDSTKQDLEAVKPQSSKQDPAPKESLLPGEEVVPLEKKKSKSKDSTPAKKPKPDDGERKVQNITPTPSRPKESDDAQTTSIPSAIQWRDGAYYMIGADGKKQKIEYKQYSKSNELGRELNEEQKKRLPLVADISIFLEAFSAENPKESGKVEKAWKSAIDFLQNGSSDSQKITNQIVVDTIGAGWGASDWYQAFAIKDDKKRRLELYKLIKGMGQYELVVSHIANEHMKLWTPDQVKSAITKLSQGGTLDNFSSESSKKIAKEMDEAKSIYQNEWTTNKLAYIQAYKKEYKIPDDTTLTSEQLKKAEDAFMDKALDQVFRMSVLKDQLNREVDWKGDHANPTMDLASSILGTGTINMSSRMARETTKMIAIEAIALAAGTFTMGVGTVAVNALSATRFARLVTLGTETGTLARLGVSTVGRGVTFELGHGGAKSLIEGENMYSMRGFGDSVLFMGVLGSVNRVLSGTNKLAQWSRAGSGGVQFAKGVFIDGTALNIAGVTSKIAFQDNIVWSPEEVAQAYIMATFFRGASKFTASKNPKGEIEVRQVEVRAKEGVVYSERYIVNGKEYRWSSKQEAFVGKNGEKYTKEQFEVLQKENAPKIDSKQAKDEPSAQTSTEAPVQKATEKPAQVKAPEAVVKNTEAVIAEAASPGMARKAMDSVVTSTRKMGESFSAEWLEKMAHKLGVGVNWLADQSVGPVFRMVTGNNPGALLSLVNPMGGWGGKASTYGKNFVEHWKHPVKNVINLTITGERKDGQGALSAIAKNVVFAGGITALDYFAVPNEDANKAENMAQNYYEMILLGWLGVVLMEIDPIKEGALDVKNWVSDRIQAKPF